MPGVNALHREAVTGVNPVTSVGLRPLAGFRPLFDTSSALLCKDFACARGSRLLEELFRGGAVGLGAGHVGFDPRDLFLQGFDPLLELVDRQGVEVLLLQLGKRILRPIGKELVQIHA